jgi:hypothetical protein
VQTPRYGLITQTGLQTCIVDVFGDVNTMAIGYFPQRSNNMGKPGKLANGHQVDAFIEQAFHLVFGGRTSG